MAVVPLIDVFSLLSATNWSTQIVKVEIDATVVDLDATAFGGSGWVQRVGGLKDGKIAIDFNQDYAVAGLDSVWWPFLGTLIVFEFRPTSAARSTANPAYTGSFLVNEWKPISGKVGDLATVSVTFPTSGVVLRQTS